MYKVYEDISQIVRKDVSDKIADDVPVFSIVYNQIDSMSIRNIWDSVWNSARQIDHFRNSVRDCMKDWIKENEL